jgi:feruloyl esterase
MGKPTMLTFLRSLIVPAMSLLALMLGSGNALAATACERLATLMLPDAVITVAERVTSGRFETQGGGPGGGSIEVPAMCRVAGTVAPQIRFEVWMPEAGSWNGRFQAVGGGGLAGIISYPAMGQAIRAGFATASTDTGHVSTDTTWMRNRQQMIDYGYRAIHEMTVKSKAIIEAHYGSAPMYSYFNGCSTGGRQGLMTAQRFPNDYDGIVSGAPVNNFTNLHIGQLWAAHATLMRPGARLGQDELRLLHTAALEQCDANDGVRDGIITDPRSCDFDPGTLACAAGQSGDCLTSAQVDSARLLYQGAVNLRTGEPIYPGLEPGGEGPQPGNPGWGMLVGGEQPFSISTSVINGMAFANPEFDWRSFDFDRDVAFVRGRLSHLLDAVDADLRDFRDQGGKLILYHGWNDPGVMPREVINYYDKLASFAERTGERDGLAATRDFARLFMMPGMGHCRGGDGPDQADFMSALMTWVEEGRVPERIIASRMRDGAVDMTRPLCPHPEVAQYRGRGNTNDAANFQCAVP